MKKKLEAELISIAHRVLKNHNREDIAQLQKEALNLYEKLSILKFYEDHFEPAKPTLTKSEIEEAVASHSNTTFTSFTEQEVENEAPFVEAEQISAAAIDNIFIEEEKEVIVDELVNEIADNLEALAEETQPEIANVVAETATEIEVEISAEKITEPVVAIETIVEEKQDIVVTETEIEPEAEIIKVEESVIEQPKAEKEIESSNALFKAEEPTLLDKLTKQQTETNLFSNNLFADLEEENTIQTSFVNLFGEGYQDLEFVKADKKTEKNKTPKTEQPDIFGEKLVADLYNNTITLGLNDRIAFQTHLFNDSDQDLNRVISQLNTMNNLSEALDFIDNMVKPDYNDWKNKQEYEDRFMALVQKRFS
ncbi:hypothetical protein K5I29_12260 [Flavobacterium agricola]|uniref:Uncharacterized protein n=1 Tax=Flavobacterium agricola TaxID=2870839 RepID=A0ABY6LY21_9FLAO|nr:hypothetical protein [Flavobacterium agricola]UYW01211.1 hypothetical protein K5I29_12260 [Flavobacterium agricola]